MSDARPDETNNGLEPPSIGDWTTLTEPPDAKRPEAKRPPEEPPSIGDWPTLGEGADPKHPVAEPPSIGSLPTREEWSISDDRRFHSRRWQSGEEILGRYVVEKELGQGGMGVVYGCFDKVGGVRVAVKALPPELSHNSVEMEEVRENFQLVDELRHPNIAGVRTLEKDARGEYFLVMDIAEGESLRKWIRRKWKAGGVTLAEAVGVLRQVATALDYAHSEKVVHRDVKPGNVMIDANGRVKVLDFGLAAQIRTSLSRASQAYRGTSGTGPYMAPEQWRGQPQDAKADEYALGVLAYEMLSGRLPFENADAVALREAVLREDAPGIPYLPKYAMAAIRRAMAKKAETRFGSCREFVVALAGAKLPMSKRGGGWSGWIILVFMLVALGMGLWQWNEYVKEKVRLEAEQRQEIERLAAAKQMEEAQKAEEERLAAEKKAQAERLAAQMAEEERRAAAKREAEEKAAAERAARLEAERAAAKREAEEKAAAERAAREQAEREAAEARRQAEEAARRFQEAEAARKKAEAEAAQRQRDWEARLAKLEQQARQSATVAPPGVASQPADGRQAGATKTITLPGGVAMEMVWCPPGTFMMGARGSQHQVTLSKGFWMAKYEVTQRQWKSVMGKNRSIHKGDDLPVERVTWNEARDFCRRVGNGLRLPTEAEWEYACRAGSTGDYAGTGNLDDMGWYKQNSGEGTSLLRWVKDHPVGQKRPNAWGLYDMHGNVCEWCEDWEGKYPYGAVTDPTGPTSGTHRIDRGGHWEDPAEKCTSSKRSCADPTYDDYHQIGFRPCCFE